MEPKNIFTKSSDVVLFVCGILKALRSGNIDTFEQRLRSQKAQYFAQIFGVSPYYPFSLYIRGPYSPDLAHDLFLVKNKNIKVDKVEFIPKELNDCFLRLKHFIDGKNNRQLECIATLHWLLKVAKLPQLDAQKRLFDLKAVSPSELEYTIKWFQKI